MQSPPPASLQTRADAWLAELAAARRSPKTLDAYRGDLRNIGLLLSEALDVHPADLTVEHFTRENLVIAFGRFSADHSPASIRRAMATWGSLGRYLTDITNDIARNPMETIRRPELPVRAPRLITAPDYPRRLMEAAADESDGVRSRWVIRDVALMATYLLLGVRLNEALTICPRDIHRGKTTTIRILGKRSYERVLVVPSTLVDLWDDYLAEAGARFGPLPADVPMIRHATTGRPLSRQVAEHLIDRIMRRAGIRDEVPAGAMVHALRHGFATEAVRAGVSLLDLRDHLGHSTIAVTDQYLHSDPLRRRALVEEHPFLDQVRSAS